MSINHVMVWIWQLFAAPFMYLTGLMVCVVMIAALFSQTAMMFRKSRGLE